MKQNNRQIEQYRITLDVAKRRGFNQQLVTDHTWGNNGMFLVPVGRSMLLCMVSDGAGWDHVSVSIARKKRCPTWEEMAHIKSLFWGDHETVIEYHPAKNDYVNNHPFCLHLWKPQAAEVPTPPPILVGVKNRK